MILETSSLKVVSQWIYVLNDNMTVVKIQTNYNFIKECTHRAVRRFDLMLLEDVYNDLGDTEKRFW